MDKLTAKLLYKEIRGIDPEGGFYAWVDPDEQSILLIQNLLRGAPFKLRNTTELHATVIYHEGPLPENVVPPQDRKFEAVLTKSIIWDDEKGRKILVLGVDCPALAEVHQELLDQGLSHSFPTYDIHMSVGKDIDIDEPQTRVFLEELEAKLPIAINFDPKLKGSSLK